MLKTKSKILLLTLFILTLVSSCCLATVEPRVAEGDTVIQSGLENVESDIQNELMTITEQGQEPITTTGEETSQDIVTEEVSKEAWTNNDLYIAEDVVTVSNVVDGNAFIIGKEVTISGEIGGDLFVIADKLNIEGGYIYSGIFALANEITINNNALIYDVYAMCNQFDLGANGYIYRDMKVIASSINMEGNVRRDAYLSAQNITFAENAEGVVTGNLHYSSEAEIAIPEGAVLGEVNYENIKVKESNNITSIILSYITELLTTLCLILVVTLAFLWLVPNFVQRVGKMGVAKSFASLGIGIVAPIAFVIVSLLLAFSMIGSSILVCGIFAIILLYYIGFSITSIFFGKVLAQKFKLEGKVKFILLTLGVSIILWAVTQIPIIGVILGYIITSFGVGTTLVNIVCKKETTKTEKVEEKSK